MRPGPRTGTTPTTILVAIAVAAGCAHPTDPGFDLPDLVHVRPDGLTLLAGTGSYELAFASSGIPMPERLTVGGHQNVLGTDHCPVESLIGTAIYPAAEAVAGEPADSSGTSLTTELDGPLIGRVRVTYAVPYTCPDAQHLTGSTVFTLFPTGMIVRQDDATSSDTELAGSATCGCGGFQAPDYYFTTWYAFDDSAQIVNAAGVAFPTFQGATTDACATWGDVMIGMRWNADTTRVHPNNRPSFVLDLAGTSAQTFPVTKKTATSRLMIATGTFTGPDCQQVLDRLIASPVLLAGKTVFPDDDGIYRGAAPITGKVSLAALTSSATVAPFALSLQLGDHAVFESSIAHEPGWSRAQPDPPVAGRYLVWFRDGLLAGETVTITVP